MLTRFVFGALLPAFGGAIALGTSARAGQETASTPSTDICSVVAEAKFQQWTQPRLMIEQTNALADGSQRGRQLIVTPNTAYARHGDHWKTANVTRPERGAGSPELLARHMGLATCAKGDHVQEAGVAATIETTYSYNDDVTLPEGAELAENERLFGNPTPSSSGEFDYGAGGAH
jgi:hypothetical protein